MAMPLLGSWFSPPQVLLLLRYLMSLFARRARFEGFSCVVSCMACWLSLFLRYNPSSPFIACLILSA
jgi:hypothetical protein